MNVLTELILNEIRRLEAAPAPGLTQDPWRLHFHLMPPVGWLNDPNGLCHFNGRYHVFFQYAPTDPAGRGIKVWGHYSSEDLLHWRYEGTPLVSDAPWDCHGVYSGSALVEADGVKLFYTGNVKFDGDFDYVNAGRGAATLRVDMDAAGRFSKKMKLLDTPDYPAHYSCHIRDPKVWRAGGLYHMVLGGRTRDSEGRVLRYLSEDLKNWRFGQEFVPDRPFGFMWECPDLFPLTDARGEERALLSFSPQGLDKEAERRQNVYQAGYVLLPASCLSECSGEACTVATEGFEEWDYGFDFYAQQTFADARGRRILIAWAGLPDIEPDYRNPTCERGWQHALTLPRALSLREGRVFQWPVEELERLRAEALDFSAEGERLRAETPTDCWELLAEALPEGGGELLVGEDLRFSWDAEGLCRLEFLSAAGAGRGRRVLRLAALRALRLIADSSLLELYLNGGEKVMTSRYYPERRGQTLRLSGVAAARGWTLRLPD